MNRPRSALKIGEINRWSTDTPSAISVTIMLYFLRRLLWDDERPIQFIQNLLNGLSKIIPYNYLSIHPFMHSFIHTIGGVHSYEMRNQNHIHINDAVSCEWRHVIQAKYCPLLAHEQRQVHLHSNQVFSQRGSHYLCMLSHQSNGPVCVCVCVR